MTTGRSNVTNGVVSGVVAGILVSVTLGLYQIVMDKRTRNNQVNYVREMIEVSLENMENASDNSQKLLQYNLLIRGLDRFMSDFSASSEITFDEREKIRRAFPYSTGGHIIIMQNADALPEDTEEYFSTVARQFRGISWIGVEQK